MKRKTLLMVGGIVLFIGIALFIILSCIWNKDDEEPQRSVDYFTDNYALEYIKWEYETARLDWRDAYNLTSTKKFQSDPESIDGDLLICSWEEYQACLDVVEQKEADWSEALENAVGKYPPSYLKDYSSSLYTISVDTMNYPIDEAFFDEHNLAVVDCCYRGAPSLRSRLDGIEIENDVVTVTVADYFLAATTADQRGHIYWIPVPKKCAKLSTIRNTTVEETSFVKDAIKNNAK